MVNYLAPIYEKRQELLSKPAIIREVIEKGNEAARKVASQTMEEVRAAMKIDWM
jgi:tryptophanyl-tRNA synthetase